ncbi:hypothetical protein IWZ01DRAFT_480007 [Phyllosticta capitalensis]
MGLLRLTCFALSTSAAAAAAAAKRNFVVFDKPRSLARLPGPQNADEAGCSACHASVRSGSELPEGFACRPERSMSGGHNSCASPISAQQLAAAQRKFSMRSRGRRRHRRRLMRHPPWECANHLAAETIGDGVALSAGAGATYWLHQTHLTVADRRTTTEAYVTRWMRSAAKAGAIVMSASRLRSGPGRSVQSSVDAQLGIASRAADTRSRCKMQEAGLLPLSSLPRHCLDDLQIAGEVETTAGMKDANGSAFDAKQSRLYDGRSGGSRPVLFCCRVVYAS